MAGPKGPSKWNWLSGALSHRQPYQYSDKDTINPNKKAYDAYSTLWDYLEERGKLRTVEGDELPSPNHRSNRRMKMMNRDTKLNNLLDEALQSYGGRTPNVSEETVQQTNKAYQKPSNWDY